MQNDSVLWNIYGSHYANEGCSIIIVFGIKKCQQWSMLFWVRLIALPKFDISSELPMFIHFQGAMSDERITPVARVVINPVTHFRQLMGVITPFITCSYYLVILVILSLWPFRYRSQQQSDSAVSVENSKTQGLNKCTCRRSNHFKLTLTEEYSLEI